MNEEDVTIPRLPGRRDPSSPRGESGAFTLRQAVRAASRGVSAIGAAADPVSAFATLPTPEGRALLQSGFVLWARINALMLLAISALMLVTGRVEVPRRTDDAVPWAAVCLVVALLGASFVVERVPLGLRGLRVMDLLATVSGGVGFAVMVAMVPLLPRDGRDFVFELTVAHVLMIRAAVVPSSGRRTFWIGALAVTPGVIASITGRMADGTPWLVPVIQTTFRCSTTIVAAVLASRRIYGLERQVAKARRLGQYTLVERIGSGGMGVVFKARHALLRRPTAIKLLRPDEAGESTLLQFEREAQLTSQLTHPSTIQIYDFGRNESGVFYYAMEYLEGLTLHELVELTGPQTPARTISILLQICGSLAEAHAVGLVHRDIKPANLMVCERGRVADVVKVLDFGLVKSRGQPPTLDGSAGTIAGTPGFMAPEAIVEPQSVDARSDLYALGAVAYYLITGQHLFGDPGDAQVLLDQLNTPPVPLSLRLGDAVPPDLDRIIIACLSKNPARRPVSADELSRQLLACRDAGRWSQTAAQAWWHSHRELVHQRVRERSTSIQGSFVIGSPVREPKI